MNEAIKKWRQEPQEGKTVKKSDILEYLAFSYYSQVRKKSYMMTLLSFRKILSKVLVFKFIYVLGGSKEGITLYKSTARPCSRSPTGSWQQVVL